MRFDEVSGTCFSSEELGSVGDPGFGAAKSPIFSSCRRPRLLEEAHVPMVSAHRVRNRVGGRKYSSGPTLSTKARKVQQAPDAAREQLVGYHAPQGDQSACVRPDYGAKTR